MTRHRKPLQATGKTAPLVALLGRPLALAVPAAAGCASNRRRSSRVAVLAAAAVLATIAGALGALSVARADAPPFFFNGFETDTAGWHVFEQFGASQYVPTRVVSGTNGITSKSGSFHAQAPGPFDLDIAGGSAATNWGGYGLSFPPGGYTTQVDIYLDVATSAANDTRFDFSSAISQPGPGTCNVGQCSTTTSQDCYSGGPACPGSETCNQAACNQDADCFAAAFQFCKPPFQRDFVFNAGFYNDSAPPGSGSRFVVAAGNNAGRGSSFPKDLGHDPIVITTSGWYTFRHHFHDNGSGVLAVDLSIIDSTNTVITPTGGAWIRSDPSDVIGTTVGGNRYGWFASNEFSFLAVDNSRRAFACLTRYVATTGSDAGNNDCADSGSPCQTIQHANDVACPGDTVIAAAGTYNESPHLTKCLTVKSASGSGSTFIALQTGPTYLGALTITGCNPGTVTIGGGATEGFTIIGRDGTPSTIAASNILLDPNLDNVVIENNLFQVGQIDNTSTNGDDGMGVLTTFGTSVSVNSLTVTNNTFQPLNASGNRAFYVNPGVGSFTFQGNTITGEIDGTSITQAHNGVVQDNTVTGVGSPGNRSAGLGTWGYPNATLWGATTFKGNSISGTHKGIAIFETNNVTVQCNRFTQNDIGVWLGEVQFSGEGPIGFDLTTDHISTNSFLSDNQYGVVNTCDGIINHCTETNGNLDAKNNWWGCVAGPGNAGCDNAGPGVTFTPVASTVPVCVNCTQNSDCSDGLVCNGAEVCNPSHICNAGTPPTCSLGMADDPQCNDAVCVEPGGCTVQPKANGFACNDGKRCTTVDTCQAGVCTGSGGADTDGDGYCDIEETQAGCNPNDPFEIPPQSNVYSGGRGASGGEVLLTYHAPAGPVVMPATDASCSTAGLCSNGFCASGKVSDPCTNNTQCMQPVGTCRVVVNYANTSDLKVLEVQLRRHRQHPQDLNVPPLFQPATPGCSRKVDISGLAPGFKRTNLKLKASGTTSGRVKKDTDRIKYKE